MGTRFAKMHGGDSGALEVPKVKCPNCGFVTFPDPAECKKCGYRFAPEARRPTQTARSVTFRSPQRPSASSAPEPPRLKLEPQVPEVGAKAEAVSRPVEPGNPADLPQPAGEQNQNQDWTSKEAETANPWHDEIAARVARYRRRRGREGDADAPISSLRFDFDDLDRASGTPKATVAAEAELKPPGPTSELQLDLDATGEPPAIELTQQHQGASETGDDPAEWALGPLDFQAREHPVEIVLNSGGAEGSAQDPGHAAPRAAPLGRRFAAGMLDILVLLIAAGAFFLLFRGSGGRVDRQPINLAILLFAAAFLVVFYFSAFTALAFATPGQSAVGLRVQTFDGGTPDVWSSVWRGTGYLVSAIVMLGFAWAALDPEQLTWHDRMSRTCLVERRQLNADNY